ncbi:4042_t:CDS:2, partial [Racocetra fulgida]
IFDNHNNENGTTCEITCDNKKVITCDNKDEITCDNKDEVTCGNEDRQKKTERQGDNDEWKNFDEKTYLKEDKQKMDQKEDKKNQSYIEYKYDWVTFFGNDENRWKYKLKIESIVITEKQRNELRHLLCGIVNEEY